MHNIRVLREKMGLSQQQVAEAVHVSQQAVARWESGLAKPRADLLPQLASLFNCTIDELFWTPGNKKPPAGPGEGMLQAYRSLGESSDASKALGEKITALILSSAVTYKDAEDALEYAQELLMTSTQPVRHRDL